MAIFERTGKGKITYSHHQHTKTETRLAFFHLKSCFININYRAEIIKWVSESMRPFSIVEDNGFKTLMKTGQPDYYLPSQCTVAHDVRQVFKRTCKWIAKMLQVVRLQHLNFYKTETYHNTRNIMEH